MQPNPEDLDPTLRGWLLCFRNKKQEVWEDGLEQGGADRTWLKAWGCPGGGAVYSVPVSPAVLSACSGEDTVLRAGGGAGKYKSLHQAITISGQTDRKSALDSHPLRPFLAPTSGEAVCAVRMPARGRGGHQGPLALALAQSRRPPCVGT